MKSHNIHQNNIIFIITATIFVFFRSLWFFLHGVVINTDSIAAYIPQSTLPFFSKSFFVGGKNAGIAFAYGMKARAFAYPLFLKIFGTTSTGLYFATCAQFFISIFSWMCFCWMITRRLSHSKLVLPLLVAVFLVGMTNGVIVWDRNIAAESLTISFFLFIIVLFLNWEKTYFKCKFYLAFLVLTCIFFAGLRDTNPYFLLLLSFFSLVYYGFCVKHHALNSRPGLAIFFITMLISFVSNNYLLDVTGRWHEPFGATFVGRLLCQTDQSALQYFHSVHHMPPIPESLQKYRGTAYGWEYTTFSKSSLGDWIRTTGRTAYTSYLLKHPYYALLVPWMPIKSNFNRCPWLTKNLFNVGSYYKIINGKKYEIDYQRSLLLALISTSNASVDLHGKPVTSWPTIALIPAVDFYCICALLAACYIAVTKRKKISFGHPMVIFSIFLFFTGLLLAIFIWHADSTAYPRHLILVVQQLLLSMLMIFFFLYDQILKKEK